jgi:hypothetical protein
LGSKSTVIGITAQFNLNKGIEKNKKKKMTRRIKKPRWHPTVHGGADKYKVEIEFQRYNDVFQMNNSPFLMIMVNLISPLNFPCPFLFGKVGNPHF